jgi:transcriptional regulator with XRE-family HTH domain
MLRHPQSLFGHRLRTARIRAGIAQDRLGVLIGLDEGCSSARISRYETGTHAPPFEIAQSIASILKVPVAYFYCPQDKLAEIIVELYGLSEEEIELVQQSIYSFKNNNDI